MNRSLTIRVLTILVPFAALTFLSLSGCKNSSSGDESGAVEGTTPLERIVDQGALQGMEWDRATYAWLGVPYARPPVGDLRWKAPRDPEPWGGLRNANVFCSPCSQLGGFLAGLDVEIIGTPMGSEDCLYLNVWRPRTDEKGLPVFVYIHGGMNSVGEAATSLYHGANLAVKVNAVVVTINYRLGPLGFFLHNSLNTGNPLDDSGNYGTLDIIKALEWVQENITVFGGDAENVTVGGESAGAYNVCSLLGSPLASGLFHKAIAMSPAGTVTADTKEQARGSAETILIKLILADEDDLAETEREARELIARMSNAWVAAYLRSKSPADLLNSSLRFSSLGLNEMGLLILVNRPTDGTVIPEDFQVRFENGDYNRVPFLIGSNTEEYKLFEFTGILPPKFVTKDAKELCEIIRTVDPENNDLAVSDFIPLRTKPLYDLVGSVLGGLMFDLSIELLVNEMILHQDVFRYRFAWNEQPEPFDFLLGAGHMMGIPFFFGNFYSDAESMFRIAWSEANRNGREALSDTLMSYWANFMWTGDPNDGAFPVPVWEPCPQGGPCPEPASFDAPVSRESR